MEQRPRAIVTVGPFGVIITFDRPHDFPKALVDRALVHAIFATRVLCEIIGTYDRDTKERLAANSLDCLLLYSDRWDDPRLSEEEARDEANNIMEEVWRDFVAECC